MSFDSAIISAGPQLFQSGNPHCPSVRGKQRHIARFLLAETTTANNNLKRSSVAQIYAQILKDLEEAEVDLPLTHATALLNTTRAHKNTAIALKTRGYLNSGNYAKVVEEAKKIVLATAPFAASTGVNHKLQNIIEIFTTSYTSTESILSVLMTELDNATGQPSFPMERIQSGCYRHKRLLAFLFSPTSPINTIRTVGDVFWTLRGRMPTGMPESDQSALCFYALCNLPDSTQTKQAGCSHYRRRKTLRRSLIRNVNVSLTFVILQNRFAG